MISRDIIEAHPGMCIQNVNEWNSCKRWSTVCDLYERTRM